MGRKDLDLHGRFRGEWVKKKKKDRRKELFITSLILEHFHLLSPPREFCKINGVKMLNKAGLFSFQSFAFCGAGVIN